MPVTGTFSGRPLLGISGVYAIVNLVSGNRYVGSSANIGKRIREHKRHLERGGHDNRVLQRAWKKYGAEAFRVLLLEAVVDPFAMLSREQYHIDAGNSAYNVNPIAGKPPSWAGKIRGPHSTTTKNLISRTKRGCLNPHGTPPLETACLVCGAKFMAQASVVKSGRKKYCSRSCMGLAAAGRMVAIARARIGTKQSAEFVLARTASLRGRKRPPEVVARVADARWGRR